MASGMLEVDFGLDNFLKAKKYDLRDSLAKLLLNILFLEPGNYPSLPFVGMAFRDYLYKNEDEISIQKIAMTLKSQCSDLDRYVDFDRIDGEFIEDRGNTILLIKIPVILEGIETVLIFGFKQGTPIMFNYQYQDDLMQDLARYGLT